MLSTSTCLSADRSELKQIQLIMNTNENHQTKKKSFFSNLTVQILIAMFLGALLGIFIHNNYSETGAKEFSGYIKMLATIFIRLVQMIISPLVFTTLVVGIAKLGDIKSVGRIGGKAMGWFFTASFISLLIGMFWVNTLQPGFGLELGKLDVSTASEVVEKNRRIFGSEFCRTHHSKKYRRSYGN
jgi:Na+/H+-dicarboxylate symporter